MSVLETLVTDRTAADVARWAALRDKGLAGMTAAELAEWLGGMRGAYNAADLNRVGAAIRYVADRLGTAGHRVEVSPRTDWTVRDIPTAAELRAYLAQLDALRGTLDRVLDAYRAEAQYELPETPGDMDRMTYREANDIERIVKAIHDQLQYMENHFYWYCSGDLYAGEV